MLYSIPRLAFCLYLIADSLIMLEVTVLLQHIRINLLSMAAMPTVALPALHTEAEASAEAAA